jgi:uncharacterized protein YraI
MPAVVRAVRQKKATAMPRRSFPSRNQLNLNALFSAGSGAMGFYGDQGRRNSASNIPMGEVEMALGKTAIKGGLAALMVAAMSAGAFAWDAVATTSVNVRSGPGTQFRVVEVLQRGEVVDVEYCRNGWCFLDLGWNGNGWTSQRYLAEAGNWRPTPPRPQPPHWNNPPRPPQWNNPPRPPHWNNPPRPPVWGNPRPPQWNNPRPPANSEVCFNGPNGYFCIGDR